MTKERVRDYIPWDDYYETRDNKKTVYYSKITNDGLMTKLKDLESKSSLLDNELRAIRDEIVELEARRIKNAITK
tara:strand:- start:56 stop:280 length:225 start_codon:yes stop_codon:yes gene_type:complete